MLFYWVRGKVRLVVVLGTVAVAITTISILIVGVAAFSVLSYRCCVYLRRLRRLGFVVVAAVFVVRVP